LKKTQLQWLIRLAYGFFLLFAFFFITEPFDFIFLNTLLAYIPIELGFHLGNGHPKHNGLFVIISILWLLFYPNNPYLITDLFHLSLLHPYNPVTLLIRESPHLWLYFAYLVGIALISTIIGFATLKNMAQQIAQRFFKASVKAQFVVLEVILFLTSIGIYIGRFLRIHTIYLLDPKAILEPIAHMWQLNSWLFFLIIFVLCNGIYLSIYIFGKLTDNSPER
jgi:uncharacterized membrane protein